MPHKHRVKGRGKRERFYEELAHIIMGAEKAQNVVIKLESESKSKYQGRQWFECQPESGRLETQEDLMFQSMFQGWKRPTSQLSQGGGVISRAQPYCSYSDFQWIK